MSVCKSFHGGSKGPLWKCTVFLCFTGLRVYYILITRKTTENSILVITPLYTYMKRFFTFLLNRLFWLGDFFLLFIELNIELVIRFVEFFLETIESLYQSILQFRNLKTIRKPADYLCLVSKAQNHLHFFYKKQLQPYFQPIVLQYFFLKVYHRHYI